MRSDAHLLTAARLRLWLAILCAAYYGVLRWSYIRIECVEREYYGFRHVQLPLVADLAIAAMALAPALWLRPRLTRPSDVCLWVLYLTVHVPAVFIPYYVLDREWTSILPLSAALCASMAVLGWYGRLPITPFRGVRLSPRSVHTIIVGASLVVTLLVILISGGLQFDLSLENVYERRLDARLTVQSGGLTAYALAALSGSIAPLCIILGLTRRSLLFLGVGVVGSFSLFSFAGTKADLLAPLFLLGIYLLVRYQSGSFGIAIVASVTGLVVASVLQVELLDRNDLAAVIVSREMHIPGLLTSYYWDFFSEHPKVLFADGFLRWLWASPYDLPTARLIGDIYFWGADTNANANLWASAYANLGYPGLAITTFALGFLLRIIDRLAATGEAVLIATMCGFFGIIWSNAALETSLLSNGVAVTIGLFAALALSAKQGHEERREGGASATLPGCAVGKSSFRQRCPQTQ
jgi:hypothetical protein